MAVLKLKRQQQPPRTTTIVLATCCVFLLWHSFGTARGSQPRRLYGQQQEREQPAAAAARAPAATQTQSSTTVFGHQAESRLQAEAWQEQKAFCDGLSSLDAPLRSIEVAWQKPAAASKRRSRQLLQRDGQTTAEAHWRRALLNDLGQTAVITLREGMQTSLPFGNSETFNLYHYQTNDIVSSFVASNGAWELGETHQLASKMHEFAEATKKRHDEVYMIDIGANIGAHTMFAAAFGFNVLAFEPMRTNANSLRHSLCASPNLLHKVTLINKGLGKEALHCVIYSIGSNIGDGTVNCDGRQPGDGMVKRGELETVRMDAVLEDWIPKLKGRVGVIKIDVEGFEPSAIEGAMDFLKAVRPPVIMSEVSDPMMVIATGKKASDYFQVFNSLGYEIRLQSPDGQAIPAGSLSTYSEAGNQNYWFVLPNMGL